MSERNYTVEDLAPEQIFILVPLPHEEEGDGLRRMADDQQGGDWIRVMSLRTECEQSVRRDESVIVIS